MAVVDIDGDELEFVAWDQLIRTVQRAWLPEPCSSTVCALLRNCQASTAEGGASPVFLATVCAGVIAWHSAGRPVVAVAGRLELGLSGDARVLPPLPAVVSRPGCLTDLAGAALVNSFWQPLTPAGAPSLALAGESRYGADVAHGALHLAG
jgi:hypothetical protein